MMANRPRSINPTNLLLLFFSAVLSLSFVEWGYRILFPGEVSPWLQKDERVGYILKPKQDLQFIRTEFSISFRTNSIGFRDHEIDYEDNRPKAVILGDSFLMGLGVEEKERFANLLADFYKDIQIVNFGIMGYATKNEYAVLREYGEKLKPRQTVIAINDSDLYENYYYPLYEIRKGNAVLAEADRNPFITRGMDLLRESRIISAVLYHYKYLLLYYMAPERVKVLYEDMRSLNYYKTGYQEAITPMYEKTFAVIKEMKRYCDEIHTEMTAFLVPSMEAIYPEEFVGKGPLKNESQENFNFSVIEDRFQEALSKEGVRFIPLRGNFRSAARKHKPAEIYFPKDRHLTALGSKILAEILIREKLIVQ